MSIADKIVKYLRNTEVTEPELIRIYTNFGKDIYEEGFNEGCEYARSIVKRQKTYRRHVVRKKYADFVTKIEDFLHEECN